MRRGPLFLAAAFVEVLRFFSLMVFAGTLGLLDAGSLVPDLLRYLAVPQLLFVAAFFFLWFDPERYVTYRPLALAGKTVSFLAILPLLVSAYLSLGGDGLAYAPRPAAPLAAIIAAADLAAMAVLAFHRRESRKPPLAPPAQRGPEDIERVEGID